MARRPAPYRDAASDLMIALDGDALEGETLQKPIRDFLRSVHGGVRTGVPLNPMHQFFDHLVRFKRCPFIKREWLARNPADIPHVHAWERLIRSVSAYDTDLIMRHLQVTAKDQHPDGELRLDILYLLTLYSVCGTNAPLSEP